MAGRAAQPVLRVLLVEDSTEDAELLQEYLASPAGPLCRFARASRLGEAVETLDSGPFDIVLLDLGLPDSSGLETLTRLWAVRDSVPVIVITGHADQEVAVAAVREGAQDFLVKGAFDAGLLQRSIRYAIERFQLTGQLEQNLREMQEQELLLRTVVDNNADGIVMLDRFGVVRFANPAAESIYGVGRGDLTGRTIDLPVAEQQRVQLALTQPDGSERLAEVRVSASHLRHETLYIASIRDISELVRNRDLALRDGLTGLYNRRGFVTLAGQQMLTGRRTGTGLLLFYADVDNMKAINDHGGHQAGDRALCDLAQALRETFRASDIIGRLGGDEFAVVAVGAGQDNAGTLIGNLRERLGLLDTHRQEGPRLGVTVGSAAWLPDSGIDLEELIAEADRLMYRQKAARRQTGEAVGLG